MEPIRISGISFRVHSVDEIQGDRVELVREAENPYHARAIAVHVLHGWEWKHIGYVPRELADMVPDEHLPTQGTIVWKGVGADGVVGVRVAA